MVLIGTKLGVADNSGALVVKCIKILGSSQCNHSNIGDTLIVAVQTAGGRRQVSKHDVHKSIIVRQKRKTYRSNGWFFHFLKNRVVLVKKLNIPIGNRIYGSVMQEIRYKKCLKILIMATSIV